jgi:GNAT superfamily N-acetyltransferase
MKIHFKIASTRDAERLTIVSVRSFHSDYFVGGRKSIGGPVGYDSTEFHKQTIEEASKFYKILMDDRIIGGFWFFNRNVKHAYLSRIFVDPEFHHKGVGLLSFKFLFQNYPEVKQWSLQTPIWNTRTPKFYIKLGFEIVKKTDKFLFFTKRLQSE